MRSSSSRVAGGRVLLIWTTSKRREAWSGKGKTARVGPVRCICIERSGDICGREGTTRKWWDACSPCRDGRLIIGLAGKIRAGNGGGAVWHTGKDTARRRLGLVSRNGRMVVVAAAWSGSIGLAGVTIIAGGGVGDRSSGGINLGSHRRKIWRRLGRGNCTSVALGGSSNGEEEQRKGEGEFVHHISEEWIWYSVEIAENWLMIITVFLPLFYTSTCSMQCTIEEKWGGRRTPNPQLWWPRM